MLTLSTKKDNERCRKIVSKNSQGSYKLYRVNDEISGDKGISQAFKAARKVIRKSPTDSRT